MNQDSCQPQLLWASWCGGPPSFLTAVPGGWDTFSFCSFQGGESLKQRFPAYLIGMEHNFPGSIIIIISEKEHTDSGSTEN